MLMTIKGVGLFQYVPHCPWISVSEPSREPPFFVTNTCCVLFTNSMT